MSIRLEAGGASLAIDADAGGRLASLMLAGRERLVTEPDPTASSPAITWGSFAMLPWVGRMRDARLVWGGTDVELPRDMGAHAIHGATYDRAWQVVLADPAQAELALEIGPSRRWPFAATARQRYALREDRLDIAVEVEAREPTPVAVGWHPWFARRPDETIRVVVPAPAVLETSPDLIPTGAVVPVDDITDLRSDRPIGDRRLDHAYVDVRGGCSVEWPDVHLTLEASPLGSVVVYSPSHAVCVEPQSAWPDAIRLAGESRPTGLVELRAGERFVVTSRWSWRPTRPSG